MAIYMIYAYEHMYGGLHGMNNTIILESEDTKSLYSIATEMSMEVMDSYSDVGETLLENAREEAESHGIYDEDDPEFEEILNEEYEENVEYDIYELSDHFTVEQYEEMLSSHDAETIAKQYGKIV